MKWLAFSAFLMIVPSIFSENVFKLDITPEEAQKYISGQSLDLNYAPKLGENPLPEARNAHGDFVYMGRSIPNPGDYVEEHYLANQFHGQDGLGRALFGYTDWNQGRVEGINANGDVRGSYKYVQPTGKDFVANYWADSLGFHQEDNRPKVVLEPVTDTPDVQKAREEHFRKWKELAEAAQVNPDPNSDIYNQNANTYDEAQAQIDQANEIIRGSPSETTYDRQQPREWKYVPSEEEATSEPRGFFYKFDYEVPLLRNVHEREDLDKLRAARSVDEKSAQKASDIDSRLPEEFGIDSRHQEESVQEEPKKDKPSSDESDEPVPKEDLEIHLRRHLPNTR